MKKSLVITSSILIIAIVASGAYAIMRMNINNTASPTTPVRTTAAAVSSAILVTKTSSSLGQYFTEPNGKPLYTYGKDSVGVSNCTGTCLALWPAYQDTGSTTNLPAGVGTIRRTDNGEVQFTYNGMPLYTFVNDIDGHVTGNGVSDFTVAKPAPSTTNSTSSQPATSDPATAATGTTNSSPTSGSSW